MTPEERAHRIVDAIPSDCREDYETIARSIVAQAIREAERDAELRMRERAAKLLEYAIMTIQECVFHGVPVDVSPPAGKTAVEHHVEILRGLVAAIRLLEVS